ncbi:hypothetical protein D9M68_364370 [compost metagenome]
MKAVAAGDEVAIDTPGRTILLKGDVGLMAVEIMRFDIGSFIDRRRPGVLAMLHQIARQFRLAIDHDALAAGQMQQIDAVVAAVEGKRETVMRQPLLVHPRAGPGAIHQSDRAFLKHAGAHAAKDVILADAVENDVVDAGFRQQLPKQEP